MGKIRIETSQQFFDWHFGVEEEQVKENDVVYESYQNQLENHRDECGLLLNQNKLIDIADEVEKHLHYFTEIDRLISRLDSPTLSPSSEAFIHILDRLDECIEYMENHSIVQSLASEQTSGLRRSQSLAVLSLGSATSQEVLLSVLVQSLESIVDVPKLEPLQRISTECGIPQCAALWRASPTHTDVLTRPHFEVSLTMSCQHV